MKRSLELLGRGWMRGALGALCGGGAMVLRGTVAGSLLWFACVVLAASGYGALPTRITRQPVGLGLRVVTGLAVMLVLGVVCGRLGVFTRQAQLAVVGAGLLSCLFSGSLPAAPAHRSVGVMVLAGAGVSLLVVLAALDLHTPIADGLNHVLTTKALWDTGAIGAPHHQLGGQLVGESLFSLMGGAGFASAFEGELCGALLILLLASELTRTGDSFDDVLLTVMIFAIVFQSTFGDDEARWSGTLLYVAAALATRAALAEPGLTWHAVVIALGLGTLRHEYLILAIPHAMAAIAIPRLGALPRPSAIAAVAIAWFVALVALQVPLNVPMGRAILNALLLVGLAPACVVALRLTTALRWNDWFTTTLISTVTFGAAVGLRAIRPAQHSAGTTFAAVVGCALCALFVIDRTSDRAPGTLSRLGSVVALAGFVWIGLFEPNFQEAKRGAQLDRFRESLLTLREVHERGLDTDASYHVRLLQLEAPANATIGFWGQSAAQLGFHRNRIRDLSWVAGRSAKRVTEFLTPLSPASLRGIEYLIVEDVPAAPVVDPWAIATDEVPRRRVARPSPIAAVAPQLEPIAEAGAAKLYRVRPPR